MASNKGGATASSSAASGPVEVSPRNHGMLYLVAVSANPGTDLLKVQKVLDAAHSWHRVTGTLWVICTNESSSVWTDRLTPFTRPSGSLFIGKLDPTDRQGWMSTAFWKWMNEHAE